MESKNLKAERYYWLKSKDTLYIRNSIFGVGEITLGKYLGESNFVKNLHCFEVIGTDAIQDLDDWEVLEEAEYNKWKSQ